MKNYNTCGNCNHWLKTGDCPKEKGVMAGGPSSGQTACASFSRTKFSFEQEERDKIKQRREQEIRREEAVSLGDLFKSFF